MHGSPQPANHSSRGDHLRGPSKDIGGIEDRLDCALGSLEMRVIARSGKTLLGDQGTGSKRKRSFRFNALSRALRNLCAAAANLDKKEFGGFAIQEHAAQAQLSLALGRDQLHGNATAFL